MTRHPARRVVLVVVLLAALGGLASVAAGASEPAADHASIVQANGSDDIAAELDELASATAGEGSVEAENSPGANGAAQLGEREAEAAREGARAGAQLAEQQGVSVSERERQVAVEAALSAASQDHDASAEEIRAAATGAAHGALVQSQRANVTQIQAGVFGGTVGSLTQAQNANATQMQSASYGGAHGAVAQSQRANVTQIQYAAAGAAAGACDEQADEGETEDEQPTEPDAEGTNVTQRQQVDVSQIQEAAQGAAYGSLVQNQTVSVRQVQAAAFGGAAGGANGNDADAKKVQEATMGGSTGAIEQRQQADVTQIQAAARGATTGALVQSQRATVTQLQSAASGAAGGAISQYQSATITQIQSAASGAAEGSLNQTQQVNVVQIQQASFGAAEGAAGTAAQQQIVDVTQIQAAARGSGSGAVIQIQQINVVQVQVIARSAAGGALSQYQSASVSQIQAAAKGACEGAVSLSQRQVVSITQIQQITQQAAADTASIAAEIDIDNDVTIVNYARGSADRPDDDVDPDDEPDLRSLFADGRDDGVFLANPNDEAVTVTITTEDGDVQSETLSAGEQRTVDLEPGLYTLTAQTADGEDVEVGGRTELRIGVGPDDLSLNVTVDGQSVTVQNPNDQRVTVTVSQDGEAIRTFDVPSNWDVSQRFDPGTYVLTAQGEDGNTLPVEGEDEYQIDVEDRPGEPIDLAASVDAGNLTLENPRNASVTATVTDEEGEEQTVEVPAGESVTETFQAGTYTVTAATDENRTVTIDGEEEFEFTVEAETGAIDLNVSVEDRNVTVENPNETAVEVTATENETDETVTFEVPDGEAVTEAFEPGNYTLMGDPVEGDRTVTFEGRETYPVTIQAPGPTRQIDSCTVIDQSGVYELTADVSSDIEGTCIRIASSDVTLRGNGNTVSGTGSNDSVGVEVYGPEIDEIENVTIRNLEAENWGTGVYLSNFSDDIRVQGTVEDVEVTDNVGDGIFLVNADGSTVENVTASGTDGVGITVWESTDLSVTDVTASDNGNYGIHLWDQVDDSEFTAMRITDNGGDGLYGSIISNNTFEQLTVQGNAEDGIGLTDSGANLVRDSRVVDNGELGFRFRESGDQQLQNVTVRGHPGPEVGFGDALEPVPYDATDLFLEPAARFEFTGEPVILDTVENESLPELPENATAVQAGFNVSNVQEQVDVTVPIEAETDAEQVDLLRFDGNDWERVADGTATDEGDAFQATLTESGIYVPVRTEAVSAIDLDAAVENDTLTLENPSNASVTATVAPEDGENRTIDVPADGTVTESFEPGEYTVTAESDDDRAVLIEGNETFEFAVEEEPEDPIELNVTVEAGTVTVENPSGTGVVITATNETGEEQSFDVEGTQTETQDLAPGEYTLTGETEPETNRSVLLNGEESYEVTIGPAEPAEPIELNASVENDTLTLENPSNASVTATVAPEEGENRTIDVPAEETATESFEPDEYTVTAESDDDRAVLIDGEETFSFPVEEAAPDEPIDLNVTVDDENLTVVNPSDVVVTVTAADADVSFTLESGETVEEMLDAGNYTFTAESEDERPVTLDGEEEFDVEVAAAEEAESLEASLSGRELTVENPGDVLSLVRISNETGTIRTVGVPAGDETTTTLDPGTYRVEAATGDGEPVPIDGESAIELTVEDVEPLDLEIATSDSGIAVENPGEVDATVVAAPEADDNVTVDVAAGENVTQELDPGTYTVTGTAEDRPVTLDGESAAEVTIEAAVESLDASVDDETLSVDNPNDVEVTVTAAPEEGENVTLDVPATESASTELDPGTYELTAESTDDRIVQVNDERVATVSVEAPTTDEADEQEEPEDQEEPDEEEQPEDGDEPEEPEETDETEEHEEPEDADETEDTEDTDETDDTEEADQTEDTDETGDTAENGEQEDPEETDESEQTEPVTTGTPE